MVTKQTNMKNSQKMTAGMVQAVIGLIWTALMIGTVMLAVSCGSREEIDLENAEAQREANRNAIIRKTVSRPGPPEYQIGTVGGTYISTITNDPKTFNDLTARDGDTRAIVDILSDNLADYDPYKREFVPNLASFEVKINNTDETLTVFYTLRDDIYWTTPNSDRASWVPVTASDIVFWYNEIEGDKTLQLPGYPGQFVEMPNGERKRVTVEKIDAYTVAFHFPRIVANPILSSNMSVWPRHIFEPAKQAEGVEGVLNVLSIDTDVQTIPSIGAFHIAEYTPGVRVVMQRNPWYWKTDKAGRGLPYVEELIFRIVPDTNTEYLLFRDGVKDAYSVRPEDMDELLNTENPDYTVYNGGASLASSFIAFNQNPVALDVVKYEWFTQREFRQAMSSLLNRPRIAQDVYRGLAAPAHHFFARPNIYFDEDIRLEFTYNPDKAVELLSSIGIVQNSEGKMVDGKGNPIEFDLFMGVENNISVDIGNIFADELSRLGITVNVRPIDFQNLVERATNTYDWDAIIVSLGANYWPSGGSNVWQSNGNFHLWRPSQESPATIWEARIDYLYNEGRFTADTAHAKQIYDEFQTILLTELPLMYIVHPFSFLAIRNKWNNVFYDTLNGTELLYYFLQP